MNEKDCLAIANFLFVLANQFDDAEPAQARQCRDYATIAMLMVLGSEGGE